MPKKIVFYFALTMVLAPAPNCAEETVMPQRDPSAAKTCGTAEWPSTEAHDAGCIASAGALAKREGNKLSLKMDNGNIKVFETTEDMSQGGFGYALLDFYPENHVFVVGDVGGDSGTVFSIEGRTGRRLEFGGAWPIFSPHMQFVFSEDDPNGSEEPTHFAIRDLGAATPKQVWAADSGVAPIAKVATFDGWSSDKTVKLKMEGKAPLYVTRGADGAWTVVEK